MCLECLAWLEGVRHLACLEGAKYPKLTTCLERFASPLVGQMHTSGLS